jgi:hypothetical protein
MNVPFVLTRFLYIKDEVLLSLLISILEKDYDQSLFWASELYYSGYEKETMEYIDAIYITFFRSQNPKLGRIVKWGLVKYNKGIHMLASILLNLTSIPRKYTLQDFATKNDDPEILENAYKQETKVVIFSEVKYAEKYKFSELCHIQNRKILKHVCKYSTHKQWGKIFNNNLTSMNQKELYEKHNHNWLFYASFCPIWTKRIREHCGTVDEINEKVVFEDDDWFEQFHENYEYEIDEQSRDIRSKILHTSGVTYLTLQDLINKYEPHKKTHIIRKRK